MGGLAHNVQKPPPRKNVQKPPPRKNVQKIPRSNISGIPRSNISGIPRSNGKIKMGNWKKPVLTGKNGKMKWETEKWEMEKWESVTKMKKPKTLKEILIL